MPSFSLANRIALVTGASRGLGFQIARGLAHAGAHVLINSRSTKHVAAAVDQLAGEGLAVSALPFDITDETAAAAAIEAIAARHGRLDILVNNVSARGRMSLEQTTPACFAAQVNTDLTATFALTKRAAELMLPKRHGRIIMITSIASGQVRQRTIAYVAAQGGLGALTRAFACEYGPSGITCNAIAPGVFLTEVNGLLKNPQGDEFAGRIPLGRLGDPAEISGAAVFLASDAASYVNGHILTIDGGLSILMS